MESNGLSSILLKYPACLSVEDRRRNTGVHGERNGRVNEDEIIWIKGIGSARKNGEHIV